jgi:hypothetical protein
MKHIHNPSDFNEKVFVPVKHYFLKELAAIYDMDYRIMKKSINRFKDEIGPLIGYYYQPDQVRIIFRKITLPNNVVVIDEFEGHNDSFKHGS